MRSGVIITGGAKRVGAAMALYFAKAGYDIALHYSSSENEAQMLQKKIEKLGVQCELFKQDLSKTSAIPLLMAAIKRKMPHCLALINNASVFERSTLMETDEALFDRQFGVNFKAPFFLTQAFAREFKKGCIVNMLDSDISKTQGSHFAYLLSKKALADFTVMAALELGPKIRVNGVAPGHMLPSSEVDADYGRKLAGLIPMKGHATLDELSETVHWLIHQPHITGQVMYVDGGKHAL